jgi:L-fuconolactonase
MENGERGRDGAAEYAVVIIYCLDRFGPDRVMFASNWPVVNRGGSFRDWVTVLCDATRGRSEIDRRKLFHDNAMRFYSLS